MALYSTGSRNIANENNRKTKLMSKFPKKKSWKFWRKQNFRDYFRKIFTAMYNTRTLCRTRHISPTNNSRQKQMSLYSPLIQVVWIEQQRNIENWNWFENSPEKNRENSREKRKFSDNFSEIFTAIYNTVQNRMSKIAYISPTNDSRQKLNMSILL